MGKIGIEEWVMVVVEEVEPGRHREREGWWIRKLGKVWNRTLGWGSGWRCKQLGTLTGVHRFRREEIVERARKIVGALRVTESVGSLLGLLGDMPKVAPKALEAATFQKVKKIVK